MKIIPRDLESPMRADKFLAASFKDISRTQIQKSFANELVFCNGQKIKAKHPIQNGDVVEFELIRPKQISLSPRDMDLDVLFEDGHIIAINKPAAVVMHAGNGTREPTLVEGVLSHCALSSIGGTLRPGIVHRLDKDTTGAVIFAKTDEAYLKLIKLFSARAIRKKYIAIVCGCMRTLSGTINQPIGRHGTARTKMCVRADGKPAVTDWQMRECFGGMFSLIDINLHTGRTHQIRVHLSNLGHPILGDTTYGYRSNFCSQIQCTRPTLHAAKLSFAHPITAQPVEIDAPLPADFLEILATLGGIGNRAQPGQS